MQRRAFSVLFASALSAFVAGAARAQAWPNRPVRFILSQAAGSGPDNVARVLAEPMQRALGQAIVIDNKPGGQNVIGAQAAARATPDGYTFYFATAAALVSNAYLVKSLPYDPLKDFAPVSFIGSSPFCLVVAAAAPSKELADFVGQARAMPNTISIATEGAKTFGGITARLLNARAGLQAKLVAYSAVGAALQDVLGGHADAALVDIASAAQLVRQGRLRMLAVTSPKRVVGWEAVPALAEVFAGFDMVGWLALVAPAGTPPSLIERLNEATTLALADKETASRIQAIGPHLDSIALSSTQLRQFLRAEHERWARIASDIGLLPE